MKLTSASLQAFLFSSITLLKKKGVRLGYVYIVEMGNTFVWQ